MIKPAYYHNGGIDVIEYLQVQFGRQAAIEFCRGNVIKYITRYQEKNGIEDLEKAQTYIERMKELEGAANK